MTNHYRYLIVGGGMTGSAAVQGIRKEDPQGSIGLFGSESNPPYNRPPLTKGLWKGKPLEKIFRKTDYPGLELRLNEKITSINPDEKCATGADGEIYTYDKLLLATGGTPRQLPFDGQDVLYYRTVEDYKRLRELTGRGNRMVVIGGGFIGSELAAALAMNGEKAVLVFPEQGIGARTFPADLSLFLNEYYREKGVVVMPGTTIQNVERRAGDLMLIPKKGQGIEADIAIAGLGIQPNTELAEKAGLQVSNGITVDEFLRTSQPDIYAAGDVASFYNPALGTRLRVEHEDNANSMGLVAGRNMAGEAVPYDYLPFFYSDLFDLGYEAIGELNSQLEVVADWREPFRKGVLYYLKDGRVRGVLLWNVWNQVDAARRLIAEPGPFKASELRGRIPAA